MKILPISQNKNGKNQSFTMLKADRETVSLLREIPENIFEFYPVNIVTKTNLPLNVHQNVPKLGMLMSPHERALFDNASDHFITKSELDNIREKYAKDGTPIAEQLLTGMNKPKELTLETAKIIVEAELAKLQSTTKEIAANLTNLF